MSRCGGNENAVCLYGVVQGQCSVHTYVLYSVLRTLCMYGIHKRCMRAQALHHAKCRHPAAPKTLRKTLHLKRTRALQPARCSIHPSAFEPVYLVQLGKCWPLFAMGDRLTQLQDAVDQVTDTCSQAFIDPCAANRLDSSRNSSSPAFTMSTCTTTSCRWGQTTRSGISSRIPTGVKVSKATLFVITPLDSQHHST